MTHICNIISQIITPLCMIRHYCVILRDFADSTLPSYKSTSSAAVGK